MNGLQKKSDINQREFGVARAENTETTFIPGCPSPGPLEDQN